MTFNPTRFRALDPEHPQYFSKIRTSANMTLILVQVDGYSTYATDVAGKDDIIARRGDGDILLLAWTGKWSTDIFLLTDKNLADFYRDPPKPPKPKK